MNIITANNSATQESLEAAEAIQFAVAGCDVGAVLVARSKIGVCAILLSANAEELEKELDKIFPGHVLVYNEHAVKEDMFKVHRFLASPNAGLNIHLDIRGTPFQRKVWKALRTIQAGRPLTFTQLARCIPGSKSLRAIGQACAENPIALAIPCHRVMGNSGSLLNYRYGAPCKRSLINREVAIA
jgi:O-6-methylguanine DNA methyltransferase